jgi:hypothetical protein
MSELVATGDELRMKFIAHTPIPPLRKSASPRLMKIAPDVPDGCAVNMHAPVFVTALLTMRVAGTPPIVAVILCPELTEQEYSQPTTISRPAYAVPNGTLENESVSPSGS